MKNAAGAAGALSYTKGAYKAGFRWFVTSLMIAHNIAPKLIPDFSSPDIDNNEKFLKCMNPERSGTDDDCPPDDSSKPRKGKLFLQVVISYGKTKNKLSRQLQKKSSSSHVGSQALRSKQQERSETLPSEWSDDEDDDEDDDE